MFLFNKYQDQDQDQHLPHFISWIWCFLCFAATAAALAQKQDDLVQNTNKQHFRHMLCFSCGAAIAAASAQKQEEFRQNTIKQHF